VIAATGGVPPIGGLSGAQFLPEELEAGAPALPLEFFHVRPDYFQIAGIPLLEGRLFGPEDRDGTEPVAIVSEAAARRLWPGRSSVGRRFRRHADAPLLTVVGVVPSIKTVLFARDGVQAYMPAAQAGDLPYLLFRVAGDPRSVMTAVRAQIRTIDPSVTLDSINMMDNYLAESDPMGPTRFYALFLGGFAGLGLLTAAIGLYGVLSYSVSHRTHEIGVRLVLGARLAQVRSLVFAEALVPVVVGVTVGMLATIWLSRLLESRLFQVAPNDPWVLGGIVATLFAACALAVVVPVRRATRIAPADALRAE
jgi:putative ABC transport system permease protein